MGKKSKKKIPKNGFKKGYVPWNAGKKMEFEKIPELGKYVRLSSDVYESRVNQFSDGAIAVHNVDGSIADSKILRPRPENAEIVDTYLKAPDQSCNPDQKTYKLFQQHALQVMINTEIKNHMLFMQGCTGNLNFDTESQIKWGLAWQERFKCDVCGFVSNYHKLYEEVESNKRGRKAAKINIGAQIGLMHSPISNKNFSEILNTANIISPSMSALQKCSNKVSELVEQINRDDMKSIRENLVKENKLLGLSNEKLVRVESDARYNNPIFSGGNTPFQAGTQVSQVMCENMSNDKKIISLFTGNKLCVVASRLRGKGFDIKCPNHVGVCTANLAEDAPIGNEAYYSSQCATEVSDHLEISHITTDGDSKCYLGVKTVHGQNVESLRDVRHLSESLKRAIMKCTFCPCLFSGVNKSNQKSRFALDIKARCVAELNKSFTLHKGELHLIKAHMPAVMETIIMCYKGYCGYSCRVNSYVCAGLPSNHWEKNYIANDRSCKMTFEDEQKIMNCIQILLGSKSLELVRFLTSTQKSEAFNRSLSRCNPKNVTFARNFSGRAHCAVHMRNHKYANSVLILTEKLGAGIAQGSSVARQLKQKHVIEISLSKRKLLQSSKLKRAMSRKRKFDMHARIHYPVPIYYQKGLADPLYAQISDNLCTVNREHSYGKSC